MIYIPATASFVEDLTHCDGSQQSNFDNASCTIPYAYLISTYGFQVGQLVQAKVRAFNINGWGGFSQINTSGAYIQAIPGRMAAPTQGSATTIDRIQLNWTAMTTMLETGGTYSISSYNLEMFDTGSNSWVEVVGQTSPFTLLTYTKTGLTTGVNYSFRIRCSNIHGFGSYSDVIVIRADDRPAQPSQVTTTVDLSNVKITWTVPVTNGAPITGYQILILQQDGVTYSENLAFCDGSQAAVVTVLQCILPMASLRNAPYSLP